MNQMPFSRSAVANAFIRESSDLRNHTDKLLAGVAIVAVSLLAACQSPLAISPVAADTGSIETISSSAAASVANETLASESVRMAPYAGARSDTENIMDEEFELVITVDNSAAFETYVLQRKDSENIMDEDFEIAAAADAPAVDVWVSDGYLIRWKPEATETAPAVSSDDSSHPIPLFGDQVYEESAALKIHIPELPVLQSGNMDNLMDHDNEFGVAAAEALQRSATNDRDLRITPDGWFVAPEQGYQFGFQ